MATNTQLSDVSVMDSREASFLLSILDDNEAWWRVADALSEDDFASKRNRQIFSAIKAILSEGEPADIITVCDYISQRSGVDLLSYIGDMRRNGVAVPANIESYAEIIRRSSVDRTMSVIANEMTRIAKQNIPVGEKVAAFSQAVSQVSDSVIKSKPKTAKEVMGNVLEYMEMRSKSGSEITGSTSGFKDLDVAISGLIPGDFIIVAGRPSMGKTTFAMNIADHTAVVSGLPTLIFSLEMPAEQIAMRSVSSMGSIEFNRVRNSNMNADEWDRFAEVSERYSEAPLGIEDKSAVTPNQMRASAARFKAEHGGIGLIVVDYIQLMGNDGKYTNPEQAVSELSRSLKGLAKDMGCPVIALSQLNRSLEQRPNKRPIMSDLRQSGALEQDADIIIFLYRDEVYNDDSPLAGFGEAIIAKQRNGALGTIALAFEGRYVRYRGLAADEYSAFARADLEADKDD